MKQNKNNITYVPTMLILNVQCIGCKKTFAPRNPLSVPDVDSAHAVANGYHDQLGLGIICVKREFIISYATQLVDERIIKQQQSVIIPANGKNN